MGRTQAFDTQEVIRSARTVFWEHGYEDASLPDLERATGLSRSSIYHAFGSKRGLFDAALTSYLGEVIRPRLLPLNTADVAPDAIVKYFTGLKEALAQRGTLSADNGCLLLNVAGAPISNEEAVSRTIAGYRQELRTSLLRGVAAHRTELDLAAQEQLATVLSSLVIAAMTLARVDNPQALATLDTALILLGS
ncbi:DNA-binding transcriptional regulator, AcrR family [Arthrobacter alpinus]|uniref:DNA-binding transcriptional regulator, AcrR family n=1 Tax=Arthrobacter alpinus TaxID=656366 RepID=A0A1H5NKF8_9MICC|nr:TetR/AcrR family transcriptional regulator [Arthrobacter alpinus]SEF02129.1 DNA-binding transcriptional regulator, AcrR family [Arthrobacter alpinus]